MLSKYCISNLGKLILCLMYGPILFQGHKVHSSCCANVTFPRDNGSQEGTEVNPSHSEGKLGVVSDE